MQQYMLHCRLQKHRLIIQVLLLIVQKKLQSRTQSPRAFWPAGGAPGETLG